MARSSTAARANNSKKEGVAISEKVPEDNTDISIGPILRHARIVQRLTLKQLADMVDCSESMISKIENDRTAPSLQLLHKITQALEISIGALFSDHEGMSCVVMRQGKRQMITTLLEQPDSVTGVTLEWLVPYPESQLLSGSIHIVAPGGGSDGKITHRGEEVGYVLTGEFELTVGDETHHLKAGDSFFFRSEIPHGYRNPGKLETRVLWINTPPTF